MADVLLTLGAFEFSMDTAAYDELVRINEWRWPALELIGREPVLQYTGPGVETIEVEGRIYPAHKGGLGQLEALRELANTGKPQMLTDGLGRVWGKFVIHRLQERQTYIAERGMPLRQDFTLSLAKYGATQ